MTDKLKRASLPWLDHLKEFVKQKVTEPEATAERVLTKAAGAAPPGVPSKGAPRAPASKGISPYIPNAPALPPRASKAAKAPALPKPAPPPKSGPSGAVAPAPSAAVLPPSGAATPAPSGASGGPPAPTAANPDELAAKKLRVPAPLLASGGAVTPAPSGASGDSPAPATNVASAGPAAGGQTECGASDLGSDTTSLSGGVAADGPAAKKQRVEEMGEPANGGDAEKPADGGARATGNADGGDIAGGEGSEAPSTVPGDIDAAVEAVDGAAVEAVLDADAAVDSEGFCELVDVAARAADVAVSEVESATEAVDEEAPVVEVPEVEAVDAEAPVVEVPEVDGEADAAVSDAGGTPAAVPAPAGHSETLVPVGTIVMTSAGSNKAFWDKQEAEIIGHLANGAYKTKMLTGPKKGEKHRYTFDRVTPKPAPASEGGGVAPASGGGAPASEGGAPASESGAPASASGAPACSGGAPASASGAPACIGGASASGGLDLAALSAADIAAVFD